MRLAMVGRYYNRQGGVSRCLAELSDRAAREHEVTVFSHEILDRDGSAARFVRLPMLARPAWLQTESFALALRRALRSQPFDLVHVHDAQGLDADVYTAHSCYRAYIDMRREAGGLPALLSRVYPPHVVGRGFERWCYRRSSVPIIALTPAIGQELVHHLGIAPERIRVIPNGVDTRAFTPAPSKQEARRGLTAVLGEPEPGIVQLLFAGYEFHRKGLARIIEALAKLDDPRLRLWVAGKDEPRPYGRLARRLGVGERVRFLGHQENMAPLFRAADAFVFPSIYEAFPLVLLEALACGTPVITSRGAGMADFLVDGREGFLIWRAEDSGELAAALGSFLEARNRWPDLQANARALAERFDWDEVWSRTRVLYEEVAARS